MIQIGQIVQKREKAYCITSQQAAQVYDPMKQVVLDARAAYQERDSVDRDPHRGLGATHEQAIFARYSGFEAHAERAARTGTDRHRKAVGLPARSGAGRSINADISRSGMAGRNSLLRHGRVVWSERA